MNAAPSGNVTQITGEEDFETQLDSGTLTEGFYARYPGTYGNGISVATHDGSATWGDWQYAGAFDVQPDTGNNEMAVAVIVDSEIVESYLVGLAQGDKNSDGGNIWAMDTLNQMSKLIWINTAQVTNTAAQTVTFSGGIAVSAQVDAHCDDGSNDDQATCEGGGNTWVPQVDAGTVGANEYMQGWDLLANADEVNISLAIAGGLSNENSDQVAVVSKYIIEVVAEGRKDCIAIVSPPKEEVVNVGGATNAVNNVISWRTDVAFNSASSYGTLDGNYKYVYDVYADTYRWIGFSGDVAGLMAHTDSVRDAWWSPGGLNRGQIKGVVKLAYQPTLAHRDQLYMLPNGINPIVTFPGQGTVLWGDRTLLVKPSAFDRINVRRLFIILEKAISISAKYFLFEFNNEFTRKNFLNMVNPYLNGIKARQGMYDFYVQCDASNNTPEVIDGNQFVASMFIKPSKSINFITLNFVATKTGVDFAEVIGQV
jgi:hypothetical protein